MADPKERTFYQALGVAPEASVQDIKAAYRRRAVEMHPDRYAARPTKERKLAESEIRLLNEAYAVLSKDDRRKLYDKALRTGEDFYRLEQGARPESAAEKEVREAAEHLVVEATRACVETLVKAVQALTPAVRWREEAQRDPYFDALLTGTKGPVKYVFHLKVLPLLGPDDIPGVVAYAKGLLGMTRTSLIRDQHSYLLVGRTLKDGKLLAGRIERFNLECWREARPRAPRAFIAYTAVDAEAVAAPAADQPDPDLPALKLRLAPLFRF